MPVDNLRDMKFKPPEFEGNLNLELYVEWVQFLDRFFGIKNTLQKPSRLPFLRLKKCASLWYENTKKQRNKEGKSHIKTWSKLKKLMLERFLPYNCKYDHYLKVTFMS